MKTRTCQNCINIIEDDDSETWSCDYEFFIDEKIENAILFVPVLFDCDHHEWDNQC